MVEQPHGRSEAAGGLASVVPSVCGCRVWTKVFCELLLVSGMWQVERNDLVEVGACEVCKPALCCGVEGGVCQERNGKSLDEMLPLTMFPLCQHPFGLPRAAPALSLLYASGLLGLFIGL